MRYILNKLLGFGAATELNDALDILQYFTDPVQMGVHILFQPLLNRVWKVDGLHFRAEVPYHSLPFLQCPMKTKQWTCASGHTGKG